MKVHLVIPYGELYWSSVIGHKAQWSLYQWLVITDYPALANHSLPIIVGIFSSTPTAT